ncbi:MAG TPA: hypothetical protein VG184_03570 [Acidimicrobiales bacterium]|jgi:hypothetical protein|nr:hypothetical protein [Acidimicrobiales bacterium]
MTTVSRTQALRDLIDLREPVADAVRRLRAFPWDSDAELTVLGPGNVIHVLDLYLHGVLASAEVEEWAEAIEGRDDIGYEFPHGETLKQLIFELANPLLTRQLEPSRAREWKDTFAGTD